MLNGKKIPYDEVLGKKIVDLRQNGYTWKEVDALLFPGHVYGGGANPRNSSFGGDFIRVHLNTHPHLEAAFTKRVIGGFSPTQIVVKKPGFEPRHIMPKVKKPEHETAEAFLTRVRAETKTIETPQVQNTSLAGIFA